MVKVAICVPKLSFSKGSNRKVILIGNYAIKVPTLYSMFLFLEGCKSNWGERVYCKMMDGVEENKYYDLVAPSIFCVWFGLLQIQRRITQPISDDDYLHPEFIEKFGDVCGRDFKPDNFGYYKGRLVCCDYG